MSAQRSNQVGKANLQSRALSPRPYQVPPALLYDWRLNNQRAAGEQFRVGDEQPRVAAPELEMTAVLSRVNQRFSRLKYMTVGQAEYIRSLVNDHGLRSLLELGTFQGKGTAFLASILEERGEGMVTTLDREQCLELKPNAKDVLAELQLSHRVDIRLHKRSFTMTLMKMLEEAPQPVFDFCYFDGAHIWDGTGFCFLLVDKLLMPGSWIILDDMDWTLAGSARAHPDRAKSYAHYTEEEMNMAQVRKVWEILVKGAGYINMSEPGHGWGVAQKPF